MNFASRIEGLRGLYPEAEAAHEPYPLHVARAQREEHKKPLLDGETFSTEVSTQQAGGMVVRFVHTLLARRVDALLQMPFLEGFAEVIRAGRELRDGCGSRGEILSDSTMSAWELYDARLPGEPESLLEYLMALPLDFGDDPDFGHVSSIARASHYRPCEAVGLEAGHVLLTDVFTHDILRLSHASPGVFQHGAVYLVRLTPPIVIGEPNLSLARVFHSDVSATRWADFIAGALWNRGPGAKEKRYENLMRGLPDTLMWLRFFLEHGAAPSGDHGIALLRGLPALAEPPKRQPRNRRR
jgi:hypothetical protein